MPDWVILAGLSLVMAALFLIFDRKDDD